jgi:hypothetical protein
MNKLSKEKRDKLLMVGVATLMIVALWWNFVIGSQSEKLAGYNRTIAALRDKVDKAERLSRLETVIGQNLQASRKLLDSKQESMAPAALLAVKADRSIQEKLRNGFAGNQPACGRGTGRRS